MDSSSQLTIAYDMLYYVKFTALSIKTISRPLPIIAGLEKKHFFDFLNFKWVFKRNVTKSKFT